MTNHTPEPRNVVPQAGERSRTCPLCIDVTAAQHVCTCTSPCGAPRGCYYVEPEEFKMPPVPKFRRVTQW